MSENFGLNNEEDLNIILNKSQSEIGENSEFLKNERELENQASKLENLGKETEENKERLTHTVYIEEEIEPIKKEKYDSWSDIDNFNENNKYNTNDRNDRTEVNFEKGRGQGILNLKTKKFVYIISAIMALTIILLIISSLKSDKEVEKNVVEAEKIDKMTEDVTMFTNNASQNTLNIGNNENVEPLYGSTNEQIVEQIAEIKSQKTLEEQAVEIEAERAKIQEQEQAILNELNQLENNIDNGTLEIETPYVEPRPNSTPFPEGMDASIGVYRGNLADRTNYLSAVVSKEQALDSLGVKRPKTKLIGNATEAGLNIPNINYKANSVDSVASEVFGTDDKGVQFSTGANNNAGNVNTGANRNQGKKTPYYAYEKEEGKYDVFEGTIIPAVITNEINSDYKGRVMAIVREDVYDSLTGNFLLIPKGSKILGDMLPLNTNGGLERIVTIWDRIILPNGDNIYMDNFRGQDLTGIDGIEGMVNKRYFKKISSVVLASIFEGTIAILTTLPEILARRHYDTADVKYSEEARNSSERIGDSITGIVNNEVAKIVQRPNTVKLPSGTKTNIVVNIDIRMPKYVGQ